VALAIDKLISAKHRWKDTDTGNKGVPGETVLVLDCPKKKHTWLTTRMKHGPPGRKVVE